MLHFEVQKKRGIDQTIYRRWHLQNDIRAIFLSLMMIGMITATIHGFVCIVSNQRQTRNV